ncbi:hypothetical protein ACS87_08610 [Vibrio parahaemolyticus]|uniref:lipopolysaccharide biosynthesis protein n=1 Tax=Vibrio harveyi group TaxID=717610 RepID=UPI0006A5CFFE|nr:lipopolysaccharide biosynthesis protein [Vibrio parahaemolyticus]KOE77539.1 hypothetical protein ACS87_08610 [Vibrio parahaemolyticus]
MVKKVLKIMLGNGSAQGLQLLFIPILTNHYSPIEFGELAQVIAYSSVLCIFLSLQLNVAIVATDKEDDIDSIFGGYTLVSTLGVVCFFLVSICTFIFASNETWIFVNQFFLLAILMSANNFFRGVAIAREKYNLVSSCALFRVLALISSQLILISNDEINGLIYGLIVGETILAISLMFENIRYGKNYSILNLKFHRLNLKEIWSNRQYTLFGSLQEATSTLIYWLPMMGIVYYFGDYYGGQYSVVSRIYWPLVVLISSAIAQVLLRDLSRFRPHDKKLTAGGVYNHAVKILFLPLLFFGYVLSPLVFDVLFGYEWKEAVVYSKYISILCIMFLYVVPYRVLYRVKKKQSYLLIIELTYLLVFYITVSLLSLKEPQDFLIFVVSLYALKVIFVECFIRKMVNNDFIER